MGIWEIATQIHQSIIDLEDNAPSKTVLFEPAKKLGRVLHLNQCTMNREAQTQAVRAGLEFEKSLYQERLMKIKAAARSSGAGSIYDILRDEGLL